MVMPDAAPLLMKSSSSSSSSFSTLVIGSCCLTGRFPVVGTGPLLTDFLVLADGFGSFFSFVISNKFRRSDDWDAVEDCRSSVVSLVLSFVNSASDRRSEEFCVDFAGAGSTCEESLPELFFMVRDARERSFGAGVRLGTEDGAGVLETGIEGRFGATPVGRLECDGRGEFNAFNCCACDCASLSNSSFFLRCSCTNELTETSSVEGFGTVRDTRAADSIMISLVRSRSWSFSSAASFRISPSCLSSLNRSSSRIRCLFTSFATSRSTLSELSVALTIAFCSFTLLSSGDMFASRFDRSFSNFFAQYSSC
mmetsp:Transcript_4252/g.9483  ORF Transcript_4252/g.9483 Transcript_4252/m.9483 type:complete len:310 (-) Transcript_4252:439-1368(-)